MSLFDAEGVKISDRDDSASYLEDDEYEYEDRETLKRCNHQLGLSVNYVPRWTARDAFREFFQNWFVSSINDDCGLEVPTN